MSIRCIDDITIYITCLLAKAQNEYGHPRNLTLKFLYIWHNLGVELGNHLSKQSSDGYGFVVSQLIVKKSFHNRINGVTKSVVPLKCINEINIVKFYSLV
jgi:hypothetical protein